MKINTIEKIFKIMKLTVFLMLLTLLQVSAESLAQVTLVEKDASLEKIFREIERQSDYVFFYNRTLRDIAIDVEIHNTPIDQALDKCFEGLPLTYKIVDKTIVIIHMGDIPVRSRAKAGDAPIQTLDVQGKVTDSLNNPLAGATVKVKNKNQVTTTDINGAFILKDVDEGATLVISYVGFEIQEITSLGDRADLHITLKPLVSSIGEIEINTGYQRIKPEQSTGSIAVIRTKEYESRINTTDFLTGLQNKIPGLLINNDIQFEGNNLFQIRGISTINGEKQPLIVIDGYPTELTLDMINPNEIESVTVLKDAAAATVYGVRASNGVVVIERKKAQIGRPIVRFRTNVSLTPKENYTRYRWDKDGSNLLVDYIKSRNLNMVPTLWAQANSLNGYSLYNEPTLIMAHWRSDTDPITTEERDRQLAALGAYNNSEDYSRLFLRTAVTRTHNLDISGGNERVLYYLTANYIDNQSTKIKNNDHRFMLSGRATINLSNRLSLDLTTDFQESKINAVPIPDIRNIYPYERFEDENGNPRPLYNGSKAHTYYNDVLKSIGLLDNMYYPLVDMNEVTDRTHTINNRMKANLHYRFGRGFSAQVGGVYEVARVDVRHLAGENSAEVHQYVNRYTTGTTGTFTHHIPKGAFLRQQTSNTKSFTLRAQLNYDKQVAPDHAVNLIFGGEMRGVTDQSSLASYFGYNEQTLRQEPLDYKTMALGFPSTYGLSNSTLDYNSLFGQGYTDNRYISAYSNAVYAYKGKYSITGSFRIDQSNLFGTNPKYRYKPLWSVGAAWNVDKEPFVQDLQWINALKLRTAYGFNGNVAKNALPLVIAADASNYIGYPITFPALQLSSYANSSLRWEQTHNLNMGLDYRIMNRIDGSIDYYVKRSTDLLANTQIDATKGGTSAMINQASIRNQGWEVSLHADWITKPRFNWYTGLVFSHNTSKVLAVYNTTLTPNSHSFYYADGFYSKYLEGYAVGALFAYRYAGLDNEGYPLIYDQEGATKRIYTSDSDISDVDYLGSTVPTFNLGLSNRVDIGNFYVYAMVNYYSGFRIKVPVPNLPFDAIRPLEGAGNYWKQPGDEANPDLLPGVTTPGYTTNYSLFRNTDRYTVKGAYFTLGDVTLSYSFRDSKWVRKIGVGDFELRLQGSNLYTVAFNKYKYSIATGSYEKSYLTPTYTLGLHIDF